MAKPTTTLTPTSGRHAKKSDATLVRCHAIEHGLGDLSLREDSTDDKDDGG